MIKKLSDKQITILAQKAQAASRELALAPMALINELLLDVATELDRSRINLQKVNRIDLDAAKKSGLSGAFIDRLTLSDKTIDSMIQGLKTVAKLPSPAGGISGQRTRPNGLKIHKVRVPIGVIAIIYESRPNITIDAAALCIKSQNAVILRGGSDAFASSMALAALFGRVCIKHNLPGAAVQLVPSTDRGAIGILLKKSDYIDLVIPRGGEGLIRTVVEQSRIPVIKHYKGICHVFVSRHADLHKALAIVENAKVQRPGVCNAMETLLLDARLPKNVQKSILKSLLDKRVTLFGTPAVRAMSALIKPARKEHFGQEFLDLRCAVTQVSGVQEAIDHINHYGSHHTDAIVSENSLEQRQFINSVDSASVMVNASTRFSDGGEYGMGCEIGISTDKLHARGPMGLEELTTYKWVVMGKGQIRE